MSRGGWWEVLPNAGVGQTRVDRGALHALLRAAQLHADACAAHDRAIECAELCEVRLSRPGGDDVWQSLPESGLCDVRRGQMAAWSRDGGEAEALRVR